MSQKPDEYYKENLEALAYQVTRCAATEAPFSGKYTDHTETGKYHCICCDQALFASTGKYPTSCGWPSFFESLSGDPVALKVDETHGMVREEAICSKCTAHLGHRFPDGPPPTGLRYCINSAALTFKAAL